MVAVANAFTSRVRYGVGYYKFVGIFLLFLLLNFDQTLAIAYMLLLLVDYIWFQADSQISFPFKQKNPRFSVFQGVIEAIAATGIFLLISTVLVSVFQPEALVQGTLLEQSQSIFVLLATSTPILQGSKFLTFVGWGVLIPVVETTFFFGRLQEGLATYMEPVFNKHISTEKFSKELFAVWVIVASLFTLFHLTVKGMDSIALLVTFVFAMISCFLVMRFRQTIEATFMHIFVNSAAVLAALGVSIFSIIGVAS